MVINQYVCNCSRFFCLETEFGVFLKPNNSSDEFESYFSFFLVSLSHFDVSNFLAEGYNNSQCNSEWVLFLRQIEFFRNYALKNKNIK